MLKQVKAHRKTVIVLVATVMLVIALTWAVNYRTVLHRGPSDELRSIQISVTAMMRLRGVDSLPNPTNAAGGVAVKDMSSFPDVSNGHVLYGAAIPGKSTLTSFSLRRTKYYYTCDEDGVVSQWSDASIEDATLLGTGSV